MEEGGAVRQQDGTYALAPHIPCGVVTPEFLRRIADVAERYGAACLKITGATRIALIGIQPPDLEAVWADLGVKPGRLLGLCVRSVRCCPGITYCRLGQRDSLAMGQKLDSIYHGMELPNKCKMAVSGCPINCAESWVRDIGLFARDRKWVLAAGGNVGSRPRLAQELLHGLEDDQAMAAVGRIIDFYKSNARRGERIGRMMERMGAAVLAKAAAGE